MYKAICYCEGTGSHSTALGSALAHKNSIKEKPPPLGDVPKGAASKDAGVTALQAPKTGVVGHSSLSERHESSNGPGTAQETVGMDGCPVSVFPCPLRYSPSRGHAAFLRVSTTRERQKLRGFNPCGVSLFTSEQVRQEVYPNDSFNNESLNTVAFHCERKRRRSRIATNGLHISHFL
jgi:hypothetical protein